MRPGHCFSGWAVFCHGIPTYRWRLLLQRLIAFAQALELQLDIDLGVSEFPETLSQDGSVYSGCASAATVQELQKDFLSCKG
mgnify:FL=1